MVVLTINRAAYDDSESGKRQGQDFSWWMNKTFWKRAEFCKLQDLKEYSILNFILVF